MRTRYKYDCCLCGKETTLYTSHESRAFCRDCKLFPQGSKQEIKVLENLIDRYYECWKCEECHQLMTPHFINFRKKYCSMDCQQANYDRQQKKKSLIHSIRLFSKKFDTDVDQIISQCGDI